MTELLNNWRHLAFAAPWAFSLLLIIPLLLWWRRRQRTKAAPALRLTTLSGLRNLPVAGKVKWHPVLSVLRVLCLAALVVALARPRLSNSKEYVDSEGIDIVLALDLSGSMRAEDFTPNRFEAARKVADEFIESRPADRIGLVVFSGEAFTQCPVTPDHGVLRAQLAAMELGTMLKDGTAIGDGLATSVSRLRYVKGKSRIVILLTDGVNNTGRIDPDIALDIAKTYGVRVYTIGVGTTGMAPTPVPTPMGVTMQYAPVELDEALLRKIATQTGGAYYRATDNRSLSSIYKQIDQLEKTRVEMTTYKQYRELFFPFALIAICALALEMALRYSVFRSVTS